MKVLKIALFAICVAAISFIAGCAGQNDTLLYKGFDLAHYDASAENGALDSKYFYRNDLNIIGGDADIEWVPEERDSEYGGYYYLYTSGNVANGANTYWKDGKVHKADSREEAYNNVDHKASLTCLRSKDLNDWELCGAVDGGFSAYFESDSWVKSHCWAPEVIYDASSGKYYMYFNALSYDNDGEINEETQYGNSSNNFYDTFYLCIMESSTPVGPFVQVESESYYAGLTYEEMNDLQKKTYDETGKLSNLNGKILTHRNPTVNVTYELGIDDAIFSVIDFSPFFDDDGTLYLSFVRHISTGHDHNCMWIMRMKDMITPDFETLTLTGKCNYEYVTDENVGDKAIERANEEAYTLHNCFAIPSNANYGQDIKEKLEAAKQPDGRATIEGEDGAETWEKNSQTWIKVGWMDEGGINEGPHMRKIGDRYLYMYSPRGFAAQNYDARQSYSDDGPLGPYHKLPTMPGAIMSRGFGDYINQYVSGTGHHAMVEVDGELFCIYYAHADPFDGSTSATDGRFYAFDRVVEYEDETYGSLLAGIGPTQTVQPKPSSYTGLHNVASQATVAATNCDESTIKYLNDNFFVCHEYFADKEFVANGKTTITLKFDKAVTISAVMVYNTLDFRNAFSGIDSILFKMTEASDWMDEEHKDLRECYIENIGFSEDYIDFDMQKIRTGAASVVSFNEITVNEIKITVSGKITGLTPTIKISDIVVLGK